MKLELYYFDSCPFCQRVLSVLKDVKLKVELKDIMESPEHAQKLLQDTGKRTVPCLYIDGRPMFESADIIDWLKTNAS